MPQATDIELDAVGYMVVPGSYKRAANSEPETRPGRWSQRDFVGGQRRAFQLEVDRGWDSEGVGPAMFGQGVEPWPSVLSYTDAIPATVNASQRAPNCIADDRAHFANGRYIYNSVILTAAAWANFAQIDDAGVGMVATDQTQYRNDVLTAFGAGVAIRRWDPLANVASVWIVGRFADVIACYQGELFYSLPTAGSEHILQIDISGTVDTRRLDSPIVRMALHGGKLAIATRTSIYLMSGRANYTTNVWTTDPEPIFTGGVWTQDQDYQFLLSFGGKLYTWLAGQIMEFNPNAGATRQGWRPVGVEGRTCQGATVAGGYLIVTILTRAGVGQTWAFDGAGWWLINERSTQTNCWPMAVGGAGTLDAILFRSGSSSITYDQIRTTYRDATSHNYRTAGSYKTSLLDMGEPDTVKSWQRIGASFATPEQRGNAASVDPVTINLKYSTDNGVTFVQVASASVATPTGFQLELEATPSAGIGESRMLMIEVGWSSVSDWAPTLASIWCEYESLNSDKRQRRWQFDVVCKDQSIERTGSKATRTGRQIATDLWLAWSNNTTLTFRDVDYDTTITQRTVRIYGIAEKIQTPADQADWNQSIISLVIVEI